MEKVIVKITASIRNEKGEVDKIEFTTEGSFEKTDDVIKIDYMESEFSGMPGSLTTLEIVDNKMKMKREGKASSIMVFDAGKRYKSEYTTPHGVFKVEMLTKEYSCDIDENGKGKIYINYDMSIHGLTESNNTLEIELF